MHLPHAIKKDFKSTSNEEVKEATGKGWQEWFTVLDEFGVEEKGHTLTVKHLREHYNLEKTWAQTVALRYENDRGLRDFIA